MNRAHPDSGLEGEARRSRRPPARPRPYPRRPSPKPPRRGGGAVVFADAAPPPELSAFSDFPVAAVSGRWVRRGPVIVVDLERGGSRRSGKRATSIPEGELDFETDFGSPQQPARQVRANFVSCNGPSAAIASITGPDPVGTIQAANTRAIELLDHAINELQT